MANLPDATSVIVLPPDAQNLPMDFDLEQFMGAWYVTHSTLPLWKTKKDVSITYTPRLRSSTQQPPQFDDVVRYRSTSDHSTSELHRVVGVDTLLLPPGPQGAHSPRFKWRGKGWLIIASSRWQILGLGGGGSSPGWALTYFEKTLFTPAGLDIYARSPEGLPANLVHDIIDKTRALGGDVGKLAEEFFEVVRSPSTDGNCCS
ncbi:hypothetical protein OBBRIDRAFT_790577 [Obba rivulosa]|uniref:Lipocalin/cytosolic fatty-acid binding domain-containing protein n=1 Tax=Obba rivulosa TaxID=1052685 RepID=A0A8E2AY55_9APHY|nr:hypothetical protein OBBRIDRAFT_790577 [Obba rivulosa]